MTARRTLVGLAFLLLLTVLAPASPDTPGERPRYKSPLGLAVDPTGKFAYVALQAANTLAVVDLGANKVLCEIPVGKKPYDVAFHKGIAYVTCEADDTLVAVDVAARKVKRVFSVPQAPRGVSIDPRTEVIQVVCHDAKILWSQDWLGVPWKEAIPPQPEGNFARASNLELVFGSEATYRQTPRPFNLFTHGQSVFDPKPGTADAKNVPAGTLPVMMPAPQLTAFNPTLNLDFTRTSMDLVAHTRPRWFTPTVSAPQGRVFTNAFSFFLNSAGSAAVVLLDEPAKGYPDPTDVVVKLPKQSPANKPLPPLAKTGKAATHPLKGSRVFISSGGADTVIVLDLDKAAKHAESAGSMMGMMGTSVGGTAGAVGAAGVAGAAGAAGAVGIHGVWGGGMMGGGFGGVAGAAGFNGGGMQMGGKGGMQTGGFGGGMQMGGFGGGMQMGGMGGGGMGMVGWGGGMSGMGGGMSGTGMVGMGGGMAGMMGWQGGMGFFSENLHASAAYTLARIPTQANPRRMVLTPDAKTLIVSNHLADSLTLIDADKLKVIRHIGLGGPKPDLARRGEILFHSAKLTVQQQFTCASCHPNNGSDGLSWDTSAKSTGERLNTRALHGVRDTGPFGWKGNSETLEQRAKNTMREVHKHQLSDADADAIAAYLNTLDPPRPLPQKPKDLPAVARGKALFFGKANCKACHRGSAFTSESPRAVILDHQQKPTPYDVPSLRGVARTAPYLHDGRAATLEEIFEVHNPTKRHGLAHELTRPELGDLIAFLKSL